MQKYRPHQLINTKFLPDTNVFDLSFQLPAYVVCIPLLGTYNKKVLSKDCFFSKNAYICTCLPRWWNGRHACFRCMCRKVCWFESGSGHWKLSYSSMGAFLTFFPSIFLSDINKRTPDWTIISQIFYFLKFTDFWAFSKRFSRDSVLLHPLFFLRHYPYHQYRIFPSQNWTLVFNIKTLFQYIRKRI